MRRARARLPKPVSASTADDLNSMRALDLRPLPEDLQADSPPLSHAATSSSAKAEEVARFLVWDLVDEWGAQSFPASDPPANW